MNKLLILTIGLLCLLFDLSAQQLPLFTQYRENHALINPATINSDMFQDYYNLSFGISSRLQWVGRANTPQTHTLRGEYIGFGRGSSVGLIAGGYLIHDEIGPTGMTGLYGRVGGLITEDPRYGGFSVGLNFGMVQYRIKVTEVLLQDPGDILGDNDQQRIYPDVGFGLYYYKNINRGDIIYSGLSIPQVFGLDLTFKDEFGEFPLSRTQHFYGLVGYYKYINDESFVELSSWVKYVPNVPLHIDLNLRYQINGSFWVGAGTSTANSVHLETGFILGYNIGWDNKLKIGYGYDYFFKTFGPFFGSTHEINLAFVIDTGS